MRAGSACRFPPLPHIAALRVVAIPPRSRTVAYIRKRKAGWRAEVERAGVRQSQTFATKAAAEAWARQVESDLLARKRGALPRYTVLQALEKYAAEVSPKKRGQAWEVKRLAMFGAQSWAGKLLQDLTPADLAAWRDLRLQHITPGSVLRDFTLLRHVFTVAVKEWQWIDASPMQGLSLPDDNRPRDRRIGWREVRQIVRALGYVSTWKPANKSQETALAFLLALRTAMRAGELLSLTPADVDLGRRVATLAETKNGDARRVPLSRAAVRLFKRWHGWTVDSATRDALFRRARDACGIVDLHFHDARAEALTRMSRKLTPFELARVSGHRDMGILLSRYYRETAEQIALKL